jgi:argininosuccinate lyase
MLKGTPSGYNKDFQEDKRALFDGLDAMVSLLPAVEGTVRTLKFNTARMRAAVSSSMMATDLADFLVRRGATFRESHAAVGALVRAAEVSGRELDQLDDEVIKAAHPAFVSLARREFDPGVSLRHRDVDGGTGPGAVLRQLRAARQRVAKLR